MPRTKKETLDSTTGIAPGVEGGEESSGDAPHINGVAVSGFADAEYPSVSWDSSDTGSAGTSGSSEPASAPRKKIGRPKGSKNGIKRAAAQAPKIDLAVEKLSSGVAFIHCTLAGMLKVEELEMGEEEARKLVDASVDVLAQYDLTPDPKTAAWINFAMVIVTVYGMRAMAYQTRMKIERNHAAEQPQAA